MILCSCIGVTESEYIEFLKDPDFGSPLHYVGEMCGSCSTEVIKLLEELKDVRSKQKQSSKSE